MLDWEGLFRRYVWNEEKTPYFTAVPDLSRRQADYEIHLYCVFLGILFAAITLVFAVDIDSKTPAFQGRSLGAAFYGFSVICATILLAFFKPPKVALYCTFAPAIAMASFFFKGLGSSLALVDHVVIISVLVLLLRYSFRVVAIVRRYPQLPPPPSD